MSESIDSLFGADAVVTDAEIEWSVKYKEAEKMLQAKKWKVKGGQYYVRIDFLRNSVLFKQYALLLGNTVIIPFKDEWIKIFEARIKQIKL